LQTDVQTGGPRHVTKLISTSHNFVNRPRNYDDNSGK